ncbi:MAG: RDD family protein [Anaerolineae bacterium]
MVYASFWKRFFAYLIDSVIVGLIAGVPAGCLGGLAPMFMSGMDEDFLVFVIVIIVFIAVIWAFIASALYYAIMWSRSGQTLGKKWLGIKIVTADWNPPSFWLALGRAVIGYWLSNLVFGLGFLWMLWDDYQQGWHDKLFGTYVIEA